MSRWPQDNPSELAKFYGDPNKSQPGRQLVKVVPPFQMYYDGKPIKTITFHKKAAPALLSALNSIWVYYGRDQAKIDKLGISKFSGSYNHRKVRGSATRWSNHAYGAAIDLNASENGLFSKGNIPQPVIDAFEAEGAKWGGNYKGRKDPMHFEFVDNGKSTQRLGFISDVAPETDSDVGYEIDEDAEVRENKKPLFKSKIAQAGTGGGVSGGGIALSEVGDAAQQAVQIKGSAEDLGLMDVLSVLATKPSFWFGLAIVVAAGLIVYWRWRDHG